ncbi:MAG: hypothetical protein ACI835_002593 [Planctomycetota bacterium]|jgi:hypothetical protein
MDPVRLLQRMCTRHGLQFSEAARLLPLVKRALEAPQEVRDRLLTLVEGNLARRNSATQTSNPERLFKDLDEEVLISVAQVLDKWSPSGKVMKLGSILPNLFPDGFDPGPLTAE